METFLKKVSEKKVWAISTSIATYCLIFVFSNFIPIKDSYFRHYQNVAQVQAISAEQALNMKIIDAYQSSIDKIGPLIDHYVYVTQKSPGTELNINQYKEGVELAEMVHLKIKTYISTANGIYLNNERYRELQSRLVAGMENLLVLSDAYEEYFKSRGTKVFSSSLFDEVMQFQFSISESVIPAFSVVASDDVHELERKIVDLRNLDLRSYFWFVCLIYVLLFFFIASYKIIRHYKPNKALQSDAVEPRR